MEPKKPPVGLYVGGGLLVVLLAAAYPVYKLIAPKQVAEVKPSEPKKIDVAEPPVEPKPSLPETNNDPKPEVGLPIPEEKTPPAEPEKKAPAPTKNPGGSVTPGKPPAEPAKPSSEPKPSNSAQAEKLYEEGMAKHRGQPGSAAIPSFEQAAALGEPRAMLELGKIYSAGDGVPKDPAKAAGWYRKSADLGNASAMVFLAAFYVQGTGVAKDPAEAVRWLRKAADSGNAVAMDGLGQMYASGQGVPADAAQAVVWYRKAVDGNNAQAMYHLGLLLESGSGSVAKNPAEAAQLFQRAANAGYAPAKAKLAASGPLTLTGLDKGSLAENKSQLYRLQGSGFSASTSVSSTAFSSIGSRDGQYDHHPTAVAPDGSWLAIYMSLPPQQGRNSVRLTVQNPGGASASLDVPVQH
jgi:TPR repeat protein